MVGFHSQNCEGLYSKFRYIAGALPATASSSSRASNASDVTVTLSCIAMATSSPPPPLPSEEAPPTTLPPDQNPPELAASFPPSPAPSDSKQLASIPAPPPPPKPPLSTIAIPSYSRWFSFDKIHETECRFLPEFFDSRTPPSKNPKVYKYYRDFIVRTFRENPLRKLTYTEVRRALVGDAGSIRRVFDFLEGWGLINYTGTVEPKAKGEEKESKLGVGALSAAAADSSALEKKENARKACGVCKSVLTQGWYACDKADLILCPRCFFRGNYRVGLNSSDFKRVSSNEESRTDWTEKESLQLLEAIVQYGDDWKKVAEHVGSKDEKECVSRFIKLPFGEQFMRPPDVNEIDKHYQMKEHIDLSTGVENSSVSSPAKRRCLTPLADTSNPIMGQAAFLSAVVGSEVAEAAAQAAVAALSDVDLTNFQSKIKEKIESPNGETDQKVHDVRVWMFMNAEEDVAANGHSFTRDVEQAALDAWALLQKEEQDVERSLSSIIEIQMKEIQEKISHFESLDMQLEKEQMHLQHMKNLLFTDQLNILQHRAPMRFGDGKDKEKFKSLDAIRFVENAGQPNQNCYMIGKLCPENLHTNVLAKLDWLLLLPATIITIVFTIAVAAVAAFCSCSEVEMTIN
ncbi:hypothetical protein ACLOJK_021260 [Asimina triloba]